MKKKICIAVAVIIAVILLIPIPRYLKDGGTVEYDAVLYKVSDVHMIISTGESQYAEYADGIIVELFGIEVYNSVRW